MDFYFTDRKFNLIGIASTSTSAPISITADKDVSSIEEASRTFGGTLLFNDENRDIVKSMAAIGNYVLYKDQQGKSMFTTIMEIEHDPKNGEHYFVAEDAGMDLINGLVGPYTATKEMTYKEYFNLFAGDTGFEIRINEISGLKRTLKWEGESMTIRARLISMATQFDNAEIEFSFTISGTQVVNRYVDVRKKIGKNERITLYMNKDVNNIITKANIYDLCTAIMATGGTPEGQNAPINLKGYNYNDPNGRFVLNRTTGVMQDMESVKTWSRLLSNDNTDPNAGHIMRVKSYETTNQKTLADNVVRELEKVSQPIINYETDIANLPENVLIGDTVYLVDEDEKLFLSARVLELTRIYSEDKYTATLGDYLIQEDGINQDLKELTEQLKQTTTYVWIRYADDEDGNGISETPVGKAYIAIKQVLGVPNPSDDPNDYRGLWTKFVGEGIPGPPGEDGQTTYTWIKYADDDEGTNMSDYPTGKTYIGIAYNKETEIESNDPSQYSWALFKGPKGEKGDDGIAGKDGVGVSETVITYAQSTNGATPPETGWTTSVPTLIKGQYLWTKTVWFYTNDSTETGYTVSYNAKDGNNGNDGIAGKDGVGISDTVIEYVGSTNGTTKPTSGWSTIIPTVPAGQYLWTRTTWTYTDGTSEQGFTNALMGRTGDKGADGIAGKDGVGIQTTQIMYAQSTSGTTPPLTGWTEQVPTLIKGQYLWTQTTWVYTDNTGEAGYTVSYNAKDGNNGTDGIAGKDGVGISNTKVEYVGSTSGTVKPTTGWLTTIPTVSAGSFLWTRTIWTYDDNTTETGYSVAKMGSTGAKGDKGDTGAQGIQGIQGPKGTDGQTTYTWIKYADDENGNGMDQYPDGKRYIGMAFNKATPTESNSASDYKWSPLYDNVEVGGRNLLLNTSFNKGTLGSWNINGSVTGSIDSTNQFEGVNSLKLIFTASGGPSGSSTRLFQYNSIGQGSVMMTSSVYVKADKQVVVGLRNGDSVVKRTTIGTNWQKISQTEIGNKFLLWSESACTLWVAKPKAEKGNVATDWTPAPEDIEDRFMWIKYADSASGSGMSDNPSGKDYIGIAYNKTTPDKSMNPSDYTWQLVKGPQGATGPKGDPTGIVSSSTAPSSPYVGMLWLNTGTSGGRVQNATYRWNGSSWGLYILRAENITATNLAALAAQLGNVTAGSITNTGSFVDGTTTINYTSKIDGNINMDWKVSNTTQNGTTSIRADGVRSQSWNDTAKTQPSWAWSIGSGGLYIASKGRSNLSLGKTTYYGPEGISITSDNPIMPGTVQLGYEDLMTVGMTQLTAASGYSVYATSGGSRPTARRTVGRIITLSGAFKNNAAVTTTADPVLLGYVPSWALPEQNMNFIVQGSQWNRFQLLIRANGRIEWCRYGNSSGTSTPAGSWLNISCVYTAGSL